MTNQWIADTFTSDVGWNHLETLVDIGNRMAGTPGEREAMEATRDRLDALGAREAHIDPFDIQGWVRGDSAIIAGETTHECLGLPRSPAGVAEGHLVDVGYGRPADFDRETDLSGAIVLASSGVPPHVDRSIHRREKYYRAVEAGAAGFVFANDTEGGLAPTGSVGTDDQPLGPIPAVGVSKEVGARLARRFGGETVAVELECETPAADSGNVHAELGPETDEALVLSAHLDAHDISEGAVDNGAGTAMVVELARTLAAREEELGTRVRFVCFGAEEVGLKGSKHAARRTNVENVKAMVNLDGIVAGRTLQLHAHGSDALVDAARGVAADFGHPATVTPQYVPHSDHWPFVRWGVPGYLVSSETDASGRGWAHTRADTLDKLTVRTFREQAILLTELVVRLTKKSVSVPHADPDDVAAALEADGVDVGLKVTDEWPYE